MWLLLTLWEAWVSDTNITIISKIDSLEEQVCKDDFEKDLDDILTILLLVNWLVIRNC